MGESKAANMSSFPQAGMDFINHWIPAFAGMTEW